MATKIEWCEETWNPIVGCTKTSTGCTNCYAEKMACRLAHMNQRAYQEVTEGDTENWFRRWNGKVMFREDQIDKPLHWKKPRRIFVCSMGDLFHEDVKEKWIGQVYGHIAWAWKHTFIVLTKRPRKMAEFHHALAHYPKGNESQRPIPGPPPNLWIGVTAENQARADERIPILLKIPAAIRWVSFEPLLGPVDLNEKEFLIDKTRFKYTIGTYLDWVVVGCESGPGRRPCRLEWVESIVEQCKAAGVPVFVKQIEVDGRVSKDPLEWPEWARVREWPNGSYHH